jgi:transcriptional regulator with XRE-family HTH domain
MLGRLAHALELDLGDFAEALNPWSAARRRWEHLGRALRLVRERRGWSREQLAERAGIKVALVKRWEEKERKAPRMTTLGPIVEALGIGLGELDGVFGPELPRANRFEQLGRAIGVIRESRGLDRDALARRSGVAQTAIARWEGGAVPSLGNFAPVAAVLELDLGDLEAALDEAVAQARAEEIQGVDSVVRGLARDVLREAGAPPLGQESRVAVLLAGVRDLVKVTAAAVSEGAGVPQAESAGQGGAGDGDHAAGGESGQAGEAETTP